MENSKTTTGMEAKQAIQQMKIVQVKGLVLRTSFTACRTHACGLIIEEGTPQETKAKRTVTATVANKADESIVLRHAT